MIKKIIKSVLKYSGYQIKRVPPGKRTGIPDITDEPLKAVYMGSWKRPVSFYCPLDKCVWYNGLELSTDGWDPFSSLIYEYVRVDNHAYEGSVLEQYYRTWTPANALSAMTRSSSYNCALKARKSHVLVYPWQDVDVERRQQSIEEACVREAEAYGFNKIDISYGYKLHGPVHPIKGSLEYVRLTKLFESIREKGYDRVYGDVRGWLLRRGDDYRYLNSGGVHRVAVMKALCFDSIPASLIAPFVIDIRDVVYWPQVSHGIWSKGAALSYFNMLFDFDSRSWAESNYLAY